jgi:hypothetical protein
MTPTEISILLGKHNGAIVAPAGHGKTEMIVDIVSVAVGRQLLLTHTNAGVDALKRRLKKKNIPESKYSIFTIAAFCIRWCLAYKNTAGCPDFNGVEDVDYNLLYDATANIFKHKWAGEILLHSYTNILVDEYQDCTIDQHKLIVELNCFLPVYILGDPLQGIFDWRKPIVNWSTLEFERFELHTEPWRWKNTNPLLGAYLDKVRAVLLPALDGKMVPIQIGPVGNFIKTITPAQFDANQYKLSSKYKSVLYITKWPQKQLRVCQQHPWKFQYDETQELKDLLNYAQFFDAKDGYERSLMAIRFLSECATQVTSELKSYILHLENKDCDFSRIHKHEALKSAIVDYCRRIDYQALIDILKWPMEYNKSSIYRRELYNEMIRAIRLAEQHNCTIHEAALQIRSVPALRKDYNRFRFLSSRTLLSKGLEFDCVLIDMTEPPKVKDFYVAITRARYEVIFITNTNRIILMP